jgi:DNA modification methylase
MHPPQASNRHLPGGPRAASLSKEPLANNRLTVADVPIAELKLDPHNPRAHSALQIKQIARSITTFGFNVPVLVDSELNVIAGHGRILGAKRAGLTEVPTIRLDHLSVAQARAFMIADNRLTENSDWDERLLAEQLKELSLLDLDFELETTGFDMGEIDLRIQGLDAAHEGPDDPADTLRLSTGPPVTRPGDLWRLGRHRVGCGDALEEPAYAALMQSERAAMVFIDSPFNVQIQGHVSGCGHLQHREFAMASGEMTAAEFTQFLIQAFRLHARYSRDGALHYICMDWRHLGELITAGRAVYSGLENLCVWVKNHTGMGTFYRSRHELVFVFRHGEAGHRNNVQLGRYGRDRTNVWEYPSARTPSDEGNLLALHPTVKPVAMIADAIMDCTARGDVVLDGFLGSGSTVIAAERTHRRCFGLEIDPLYVDTIVRRWQRHTRDRARRASDDRDFDDLEEAARQEQRRE